MNWLHYLGEANLYLAVFYLAYRLLLAKETYNQLSRIYLLFSCVAAFTLPVLQVGALKPAETVTIVPSYSAELVYPIQTTTTTHVASVTPLIVENHLTWQDYLVYGYAAGCAILLLILLAKLFVLTKMIWTAKCEQQDKYKLIYLPETDVAFSFFNYLFIGTHAEGTKTIITHELVHINQKHSLDILFIELLKMVNWFNPFIYLLQNSLKTIHEYIADEQTAAYENDTAGYAVFLVNNAYGAGGSSITHSFFNYSLLKKRIIMLNQKRSGNSARLKYLIAAPVFAGLLCTSTLAFSKDYGWIDLNPAKTETAVTSALKAPYLAPPVNGKMTLPPPPLLITAGYNSLSYHLYKSINYRPSKTEKDGVAIISFTVTGDHKITDIKVLKSAGNDLDAATIKAFESYNLSIKDKPGKGTARVYFYTTDYSIFKDMTAPANHKLDILVSDKPHSYPTTKKGYEYQLYDWYGLKGANGKRKYHVDKVVIFEKNGEAKEFKPGVDDALAMNKKYGFSWPKGAAVTVKFPPPVIKPAVKVTFPPPVLTAAPAQANSISDDSLAVLFNQLGKEIGNHVKYPIVARENNIKGRVIAICSVDDNGNLQYLKIVKSISNSISAEVFRVIKQSAIIKKMPGNWIIPVTFSLGYEDGSTADAIITPPASETEPRTFEYNPNNISQPTDPKTLNEVTIRGYVKLKKN